MHGAQQGGHVAPQGSTAGTQAGSSTGSQAPAEAVSPQALSYIIAAMQQSLANQANAGQGSTASQAPSSHQPGVQSAGPSAAPPAHFSDIAGQQQPSAGADVVTRSGASQAGAMGGNASERALTAGSTSSQQATNAVGGHVGAAIGNPVQPKASQGSASGETSQEAVPAPLETAPAASAVQEEPAAASVPADPEHPPAAGVPAVLDGRSPAGSVPGTSSQQAVKARDESLSRPLGIAGSADVDPYVASHPSATAALSADAILAAASPASVTTTSSAEKPGSAEEPGSAASAAKHAQVEGTSGSSIARSTGRPEAAVPAPQSVAGGAIQPPGGPTGPQTPASSSRQAPPARAGQEQEEGARSVQAGKADETSGRGGEKDAGAAPAGQGAGGKGEDAVEKEDEEAKALGVPFEVDGGGPGHLAKPAIPPTAHLQFRLTDGTTLRCQPPPPPPCPSGCS